jgi:hypothetical protein
MQVGQQPIELLRLSTLRHFLRCEFAELCGPPGGVQAAPEQQLAAADGGERPGGSCSNDGSNPRGDGGTVATEVDLITGQPLGVHPAVARRTARARQRAWQQGDEMAEAAPAGSRPSSEGSGSGSHDFERMLDDVVRPLQRDGAHDSAVGAVPRCWLDRTRVLLQVLLTFLAGNDFVPHIPSLDIYDRPSALETLLDAYKASWSRRQPAVGPILRSKPPLPSHRRCVTRHLNGAWLMLLASTCHLRSCRLVAVASAAGT